MAPLTEDTTQALTALVLAGPSASSPLSAAPIPAADRARLEENWVLALHRAGRLSAPGLLGGRPEHWQDLAKDAEGQRLIGKFMAMIALGEAPAVVCRFAQWGHHCH